MMVKIIEEQIADVIEQELHNVDIWWKKDIIARVQNLLNDATTPREPEPEWFGTGPCQHPAWWIKAGRYRTVLYGCRVRWNGSVPVAIRSDNATDIPWEELEATLPVKLEGYPAPVGWQVLERNNA